MATVYPVCDGEIALAAGQSSPFQCYSDSTHTTLGTWYFKPEPLTDFQGLVDLLTFSPETCAQLVGGCLVLFVLGYASGVTARILTRR